MNTIAMYLVHIIMKKIHQKRGIDKANKTKLLILASENNIARAIEKVKSGPDKSYNIIGIALREEFSEQTANKLLYSNPLKLLKNEKIQGAEPHWFR